MLVSLVNRLRGVDCSIVVGTTTDVGRRPQRYMAGTGREFKKKRLGRERRRGEGRGGGRGRWGKSKREGRGCGEGSGKIRERGDERLVHRFRNNVPSLRKSLGMSVSSLIWSDMVAWVG